MYKSHLFICTNAPDNPEKCGNKNSEQLLKKVKEHFKTKGDANIRINKSGCLGCCENGIAAVLYPKGSWFLKLSADDSEKLIQAIEVRSGK